MFYKNTTIASNTSRKEHKYKCLTHCHRNYTDWESDYYNVLGVKDDTRPSTDDNIQENMAIGHLDTLDITGSSITWKQLRRNSFQPGEKTMNEILEGYKKEPIPELLNQKFSSPTSLPLCFYFGYQLLKESNLMQKCGHVSSDIL